MSFDLLGLLHGFGCKLLRGAAGLFFVYVMAAIGLEVFDLKFPPEPLLPA